MVLMLLFIRNIFLLCSFFCVVQKDIFAQAPLIELANGEPLLLNFQNISAGNTSTAKPIRFRTANLSSPLIINAPAGFELSKNNVSYFSSISYAISELTSSGNTVFIRFKPTENLKGFGGNLEFSSSGIMLQRPDLSASSMPDNLSLDIVSWNLAWFGSEYNGPFNNILQAQLAVRIMDSLRADIYMLQEIVDTALLGYVSRNIQNGPYEYLVSQYASNAFNTFSGNWRIGQKMAFLYKKNLFSNISSRGYTATSLNANNYYNWASGRYPFRMDATVNIGGKTKRVGFVNLHAKAELGEPTDYYRRKGAADLLYDSLTYQNTDEYVLIGGDFNDDLDETISQAVNETLTPYYSFMSDDFRFTPISYWNTLRGDNSYIGYPNVVDHMIATYTMAKDYVPFSCILRKEVTDWIPTYRSDVSDHYPIQSRFDFQQSPSNLITSLHQLTPLKEGIQIINHFQKDAIIKFLTPVSGSVSIRLIAADGKMYRNEVLKGINVGSTYQIPMSQLSSGIYFLTIVSPSGVLSEKLIR